MGAAKAVLVDKFIVIQAFLKKREKYLIKLTYHLKQLGKTEQTRPKVSIRKKIIKIVKEIKQRSKNNRKDQLTQELFEKIHKVDKLYPGSTRRKERGFKRNKIRNEKEITRLKYKY